MTLECKGTFLVVSAVDDEESGSVRCRSQSIAIPVEAWKQEHESHDELLRKTADSFSWHLAATMSVGSYGHPDLCASPCIRAAYAKCVKGFFCQFCHLGHQKPKSKLNKNERELFNSLNETEVLSVVLLLLREKCAKLPGQQRDALRLLLSSIQRRVNLGNVGTRQMDFALRPMRRFSIGRLLDIIQQCHQVEQAFKLELKWLTEKARAEVDQARAS